MLIICLLVDPTVRIPPHVQFPAFIIDQDEEAEGQGRNPPVDINGVGSKSCVHSRAVGYEGSQSSLKDYSKVQEPVAHALMDEGVHASFANDQVSPLDHHNCNEEGSVTGELQSLAVPVGPLLAVGIL